MNRLGAARLATIGALLLPGASWPLSPATSNWQSCVNPNGPICNLDGHWLPVVGGPGWPFEVHQPLGRPVRQTPPDELWLKATENGSVRAYASTGAPLSGGDPHVEGVIRLQWTGRYFKQAGIDVATYTINSSWVQVEASLAGRGKLEGNDTSYAEYEIDVTVTRDFNQALIHKVKHRLRMEAVEDGLRPPEVTRDEVTFDGDTHQTAPRFLGTRALPFSAFRNRYQYDATRGVVSLAALGDGESYTVTYELDARAGVDDVEPHAEAFVGDPFDAQSGFVWGTIAAPAPSVPPVGRCSHPLDAGRWVLHPDGTVDDLYTGLMWQRCGAGRTLSGGATAGLDDDRCAGSDLGFGWQQALQGAAADRLGGYADWRLPNAKELESLVDVRCAGPATEPLVFPDTSTGLWWSSTPERDPARSRMTSFLRGDTVSGNRASLGLVRLVRDAGIATRQPLPMVNLGHPTPVAEGNTGSRDLVFPVTLDRATAAAVTVDYQTADVTAVAGPDYLATAGTLSFPAGTTRAEVRVPVLGDTQGEPNEYLALTLSSVSPNARLGVARQVGTILDDEPVVSVGPAKVLEGNTGSSDLAFPVTLSVASASDVSVDYATSDGTASAGVDYTAASGRLVIPAGQTSGTIHVTVAGDLLVETDETLTLTLTAISTNATLGLALATGIIQNDDLPGPPVIDAVRYAGDMGGAGNADGLGPVGRLNRPTAINGGLIADSGSSSIRTLLLDGTLGTAFPDAVFATGICIDPNGGFVVSEGSNNRVLRVTGAGPVPFAGSGAPGSGDGQGSAASFRSPQGVAVDGAGNAYVADGGNHLIRKITPGGLVSTLAGIAGSPGTADGQGTAAQFSFPLSVAIDPASGILYVGDGNAHLRAVTPGGLVSTVAGSAVGALDSASPLLARFRSLDGLVVDGAGTVFIADSGNHAIRKFDATGVSTLAGALGSSGSQDGSGAAARFSQPFGIALGGGDLWVTDSANNTIRKVTLAGNVVTMVGAPALGGSTNGAADVALFRRPRGVAPGLAAGVVYVADTLDSTIRRIDPDPATGLAATVTAVAGLGPFTGATDGLGSAARFNQPWGVSALGSYVADTFNRTLRHVDAGGNITTVAGGVGLSALVDGVGSAARFIAPAAVWVAPSGTVYLADTYAIRRFDPATGLVATVAGASSSGFTDAIGGAARFGSAEGLCGDAAGNLYVADSANSAIRKVLPTGEVVTLNKGSPGYLDGPLATAGLLRPSDVACAADGTLYVADADNMVIRKISPAGEVSTILGTPGKLGFSPMAGPSIIGRPVKLALDGQTLYVTMWQGVMKVTLR